MNGTAITMNAVSIQQGIRCTASAIWVNLASSAITNAHTVVMTTNACAP